MTTNASEVTVLGLGALGTALAAALIDGGTRTTVWNRSPARAEPLAARGAAVAATADQAVRASPVIVVCLLDDEAVRDVLDPLAAGLAGRTLINVTTTSPAQARELAGRAAAAGVDCLDVGVLAVPAMIGTAGASVLCSGSGEAFASCRPLLERWGTATYLGDDPGLASLYDLALLAGMYVMFAGFLHGAAMVAPAGVPARDFAARSAAWLSAMTGGLHRLAAVVDGGDYAVAGQQSLLFSDLGKIVAASRDQGIGTEAVDMVQRLIRRQIDAGHGEDGFARVIESIRSPFPAGR